MSPARQHGRGYERSLEHVLELDEGSESRTNERGGVERETGPAAAAVVDVTGLIWRRITTYGKGMHFEGDVWGKVRSRILLNMRINGKGCMPGK